ncbi:hypothetical protein V865_001915 [Kwoniella europaea PYCC6329]|uniref:Zn(2)-C6 fungal-type domain-containing protein n=1 Tax=Kwoniella europaea PYCC6329 TaxID=1423913 RepID=A0AAX4KD15_9TREE
MSYSSHYYFGHNNVNRDNNNNSSSSSGSNNNHQHYYQRYEPQQHPYLANTSVFAISPISSYSDPPSASASASASTSSSSAGPSHIPAYTHIHSQQHDANAILTTTPTPTSIKRGKTGCITCRIRKKRCDEAKPTCDSCARLGLECMGYSVQRPSWLKEKDMEMKLREKIKQKSSERRRSKKTVQPKTKTGPKPKPIPTPTSTAKGKGKAEPEPEPEPEPEQQIEEYRSEMGGNLEIVASSSNPFKRKRHKQDTEEEEEEEVDDGMELEDNNNISSSSMSGPSRSVIVPTSSTIYPQVVAQSHNSSAPLTWAPLMSSLNHPIIGSLARHPWNPNHSQGPHQSQYQHPSPCPSPNAIAGPFTKSFTYPPPAEYYQNHYQNQGSSSNPDTPSSLIELSNPESSFEDLWIYLLNCQPDILSNLVSPSPIPPRSLSTSPSPDSVDRYLHHYLNVVLPLQFGFTMKSSAADLLAPLAMRDDTVMNGLKALAALHLSVYKNEDKNRNNKDKDIRGEDVVWDDVVVVDEEEELRTPQEDEGEEGEEGEKDKEVAERSFDKTIKSLRSLTSNPNETDGLLVSSISAISYVIFSGGIAYEWVEALRIARKYLWGALRDSPELGIFIPSTIPTSTDSHQKQKGSPWKRYRHFLQAIIRTDIFGSITENKASELLPIYRSLLNRSSIDFLSDGSEIGRANGLKEIVPNSDDIDNTTLLALAETVALSEWRTEQYQKSTLDLEELVRRGNAIKVLLNERSRREKHYFPNSNHHHLHVRQSSSNGNEMEDMDTKLKGQLMSDAYYESTKILLSITINGPFPKLSTVQEPINEIVNLLNQLKILENRQTQSQTTTTTTVGTQSPIGTEKEKRMTNTTTGTTTGTNEFIRTLIFPIAISACHCLPSLQPFFRGLFLNLNKSSLLFGNTKFIWMLVEKMWEERNIMTSTDSDEVNGSEFERPIFWLDVMKRLGWEGGILLI